MKRNLVLYQYRGPWKNNENNFGERRNFGNKFSGNLFTFLYIQPIISIFTLLISYKKMIYVIFYSNGSNFFKETTLIYVK